jgi:DNA repair exonuclease SbcCD ATPase subunit
MSIVFSKLRWKNFLSTGNQYTEIDLSTSGTTLIVGQNGAGKSTCLDALTFALFGKPFRNINKPQLINSITKKDMTVEIEFNMGSNSYKVVRGVKPTVFEVYCNDTLLNQSAEMRDYQEILEKQILRINYKSFCQVVILGSASFVPFMQLPTGQRRAIIEDLLDLQVFTTMNTLLKEKIQTNNDDILQNSNDQKLVKEKIKMLKGHLQDLQNRNEEFVKRKQEPLTSIEHSILSSYNQQTKFIEEAGLSFSYAIDEKTKLFKKLNQYELLLIQMRGKIEIISKEIKFFNNSDNCPTCTQQIDKTFSCDIVSTKEQEISELNEGISKLLTIKESVGEKYNKVLSDEAEYKRLMNEASNEKLSIKIFTQQKEQIINEINSVVLEVKETSDYKISDLEAELTSLSEKYNELQDDKLTLGAASVMLKDGGIKTKIINQYIPIINKLINKYLSEFDLFVEFELDEQFNEKIKSRYRDEFSYSSFSEGEKQKIDLAILFTWRAVAKLRNSLNTNLLILDEIFDSSLDGNAADDLLKILQNISQDSNIFIISHRENLHDKFENVIKFIKHKNFSRISE